MKRTARSALGGLLLIACPLLSASAGLAAPTTTVRGKIVDPAGVPLADVGVTLANEVRGLNYSAKTDQAGTYVFTDVVPAEYRLKFAKSGYENLQGIVSVVAKKENVFDATLRPLTGKPAPPSWQDKNLRAHDLYVQKKYAEALALYREILAVEAKVAFVHFDAGNCSFHLNDFQGAVQLYREAIRLKPDFSEAYANLANAYVRLKKFDEGIAFFEGVIRTSSAGGTLFYGLGVLYLGSGQAARSLPFLEKYARLEPKSPSAYYSLGAAYTATGDLTRAIENYDKVIGLISDEQEISRVRAVIEELKSRIKK